ncbi:MAG: hypothetical protein ACKPAC_14170, partial [Alphaproteobacteria bacterium]
MMPVRLRGAMPPGTATGDALITLRGIHPFAEIGAHNLKAVHAGQPEGNARRSDGAIAPGATIELEICWAAIAQATGSFFARMAGRPCSSGISISGLSFGSAQRSKVRARISLHMAATVIG